MKKRKWIKIEKTDGTEEAIDYGYQMNYDWSAREYIFTRIKDGMEKIIKQDDVKNIIHYTK